MKKKFYLCILFLVTSLLYSLPYTHYTSDYLRIRNDYNLNSQIITVLEPNMGALGSNTTEAATMHEKNADECRAYARILEAMISELD